MSIWSKFFALLRTLMAFSVLMASVIGCAQQRTDDVAPGAAERAGSRLAPTFVADADPVALDDWGMVGVRDGRFMLGDGVVAYDLATPLFSDYALKLRTLWLPGSRAPVTPVTFQPEDPFVFPVGAVITKTFFYALAPGGGVSDVAAGPAPTLADSGFSLAGYRLMETRVLVKRADGWAALPYLWNDAQTDARLKRIGSLARLTLHHEQNDPQDFAYLVPNANQCAGCHATNATTKEIQPIGMRARHLNHSSVYTDEANQLDAWAAKGLLTAYDNALAPIAKNAVWTNVRETFDARARAYLDINCSHCHNPKGPADTSGLDLTPRASGPAYGFCKAPIAAGRGTGGRAYDIVPGAPEASILVHRLETEDPGAMMPELGRAVTHHEGVALIAAWIAGLDGDCGA